jgi:hypothetical protein
MKSEEKLEIMDIKAKGQINPAVTQTSNMDVNKLRNEKSTLTESVFKSCGIINLVNIANPTVEIMEANNEIPQALIHGITVNDSFLFFA